MLNGCEKTLQNNYKIITQFDGTYYKGWQYQTEKIRTIQGELVKALIIIAKKRIVVTGSSRTDAGVHSMGHTSNFHLPVNIEPLSLRKALNSILPVDIRIVECERAEMNFNARYSALGKTYIYKIYFGEVHSPFDNRYATHITYPLNLNVMRKAAKLFVGTKDFSSFTSDDPKKNRLRTITDFSMKVRKEEIQFIIKGKSFLRYMVRNMIGTIIDVGRGQLSYNDVPYIFEAKDRRKAGATAKAKGLTLYEVEYE